MSASNKKSQPELEAIDAVKPPVTRDEAYDLLGKIYASSMRLLEADKARLKAHAEASKADKFYQAVLLEHRKISAPANLPLFDDKPTPAEPAPGDAEVSAAAATLRRARSKKKA